MKKINATNMKKTIPKNIGMRVDLNTFFEDTKTFGEHQTRSYINSLAERSADGRRRNQVKAKNTVYKSIEDKICIYKETIGEELILDFLDKYFEKQAIGFRSKQEKEPNAEKISNDIISFLYDKFIEYCHSKQKLSDLSKNLLRDVSENSNKVIDIKRNIKTISKEKKELQDKLHNIANEISRNEDLINRLNDKIAENKKQSRIYMSEYEKARRILKKYNMDLSDIADFQSVMEEIQAYNNEVK